MPGCLSRTARAACWRARDGSRRRHSPDRNAGGSILIKLIFMFKRKPGLTHEQFRHHYETSHVPLVHKYLSHLFIDYRRNYVTGALGHSAQADRERPTERDIGFDAITELWFADEAAIQEMNRITSDEAVGRLFYEDELKF